MSLNVDWSRCEPKLTVDEMEGPAYAVGVTLMVTGVPRLDSVADMHELLTRVRFYETLHGPLIRNNKGESMSTSPEFWKRWRQVRVNVAPESRTKWVKRISSLAIGDIEYALRREL